MKSSANLKTVVKLTEDLKLRAYPDPKTKAEPYTCGYGSTGRDVTKDTVWTLQQAETRLDADLVLREGYANNFIRVPVTQGMFDGIVDMVYNVGPGAKEVRDGIFTLKSGRPSTFLTKLNAGDYDGAYAEIPKWCSPGSNVEKGLRRRRAIDQALWRGINGAEAYKLGMAAF